MGKDDMQEQRQFADSPPRARFNNSFQRIKLGGFSDRSKQKLAQPIPLKMGRNNSSNVTLFKASEKGRNSPQQAREPIRIDTRYG